MSGFRMALLCTRTSSRCGGIRLALLGALLALWLAGVEPNAKVALMV